MIEVVLAGNDANLRSTLLRAAGEVKGFGREVEGIGAVTDRSSKIMTAAFASVGVAVAAGLAHAVKGAAEFDASMRNVNSISNMSEAQFASTSQRVLDLSTQLPQSANTLAKGLYDIASSGFQGAEGMKVLEASGKAASAGLTDTADAARAITGVLNAYGRGAEDATAVSDVLFQTVNLGVLTFGDLTQGLGQVVGMSAAAGVSINEVGAAIATMTLGGLPAAEAFTALHRVEQSLIDPSDALATVMHRTGISLKDLKDPAIGFHGVMQKILAATGGNVEAIQKLFPEIRAANGVFLLAANNGETYKRALAGINDQTEVTGATQRAFDEQMKSLSAQFEIFTNEVNALAIEGASSLLPVLKEVLDGIENLGDAALPGLIDGFNQLQPFFRETASAGENLVTIAEDLFDAAEPLGKVLLGIGGGAVIETLNLLATGLSVLTGYLRDNQIVVEALAAVYATKLVLQIGGALSSALETAALKFLYMRDAALSGESSMKAMTAASQGLGAALGATAIGFAIIEIANIASGLDRAATQADAMYASITKGFDLTTYEGLSGALDKVSDKQMQLEATGRASGGWLNTLKGAAEEFTPLENSVDDTRAAVSKLNAEGENLSRLRANVYTNISSLATGLNITKEAAQALGKKLGADLTGDYESSAPARAAIVADFLKIKTAAGETGATTKAVAEDQIKEWEAEAEEAAKLAESVNKAFKSSTDIISNFKPDDSGGGLGTFLQKTAEDAEKFVNQIAQVADRGLDPSVIQRLLEAGPEKAAPFLQQLVESHGNTLIGLANKTQATLDQINIAVVESAAVVQVRMRTSSLEVAADFGTAMNIMQARAEAGSGATAQVIAEKLGIGVEDVRRIAGEYVIVLGDNLAPMPGTGAKAGQDTAGNLATGLGSKTGDVNVIIDTYKGNVETGLAPLPGIGAFAGDQTSAALITELAKRTDEAGAIARNYAAVLAGGLDPLLKGLGNASVAADIAIASQQPSGSPRAEGGFALARDSGYQPPGTLIQWAEPETEGEYHAFIPRAGSKRENAKRVLSIAARDLGGMAVFAQGGFHSKDDVPGPPVAMSTYGTMVGRAGEVVDQREYDEVIRWIEQHPERAGGDGTVGSGWQAITAYLDSRGEPYTVTSTTGGRHVAGSKHYAGKAADLVSGNMMHLFDTLMGAASTLSELFYDPAGRSVKDGQVVGWTVGGHSDHVHAATFDGGGVLWPGGNYMYNGTGASETLVPVQEVKLAIAQLRLDVVDHLASLGDRAQAIVDTLTEIQDFFTAQAATAEKHKAPDGKWYSGDPVAVNAAHDPNAGKPGYRQAEDGSWVPSSFYGGAVAEDDPGWDWRTMGNRQHGIQDRNGNWFIETADGRILPHPWSPGAVASFARGGVMPHDGAAFLHRQEMVLPEPVSARLLAMVDRSGWSPPGGHVIAGASAGPSIDYDRLGKVVAREVLAGVSAQPIQVHSESTMKVDGRRFGKVVSKTLHSRQVARS